MWYALAFAVGVWVGLAVMAMLAMSRSEEE